jgi:hypothetical protein
VETINNNQDSSNETKFKAPTSKEDFVVKKIIKKTVPDPSDADPEAVKEVEEEVEEKVTRLEHTYENGNTVIWLLLKNGSIARIREGSGEDVEKAELECGEDKHKYMSSMMSSTVTIDGKAVNMFELPKQLKMKDYLMVKSEFVNLNF